MKGIVVSICDYTGNMVKPWADNGYECFCIDLQHNGITTSNSITYIGADIRECVSRWLPPSRKIAIAFAAPPCTHTAVSGAKYFVSKGAAKAAEAFTLIARCEQLLKYFDCPYAWEQPVSVTSTYCGKPSYTFNPCDYAGYLEEPSSDAYTKHTCIWAGNGFVMPTPKPVEPIQVCAAGSWLMKLGGKSDRTKNLRSASPMGFATAVYEANSKENI